jgi:putative ABC transport system ATP-binding protein
MVRLEYITKTLYTEEGETHALKGIDLEIAEGEYISITGPSGSGKGMLLSILALLDTPTEGSYTLNGRSVANLTLSDRARVRNREIGFISETFDLIDDLTVYENVELPLTYQETPLSERKTRVQEALERVDMAHRMKHYPAELSGGQQQRVAVARAIVSDPSLIVASNPTANLDSSNGEVLMDLLKELHWDSMTLVMVTDDPRYALHADRAVELFEGRVVGQQP